MCIAPNRLPNGLLAACHQCWQCRERTVSDWVGRNIAESKTAIAAHAVTLTYGRKHDDADHEQATVLTYSDVQKFLKLLRFHGFPVRYFATGEYGTLKQRAHWHIMLYWQNKVPPGIVLDERFMLEVPSKKTGEMTYVWDHGWAFFTRPEPAAIRYNCKYIQKDQGDNLRQGHMAMSKKPPLGTAYFQRLAETLVRQGLAPQTLEYRFPDVRRVKADGREEVVPFMLRDRPAQMYLDYYVQVWRAVNGDKPMPRSELVEDWLRWGVLSPDAAQLKRQERAEEQWRDGHRDQVAENLRREAAEYKRKRRAERDAMLNDWIEKGGGFVPLT